MLGVSILDVDKIYDAARSNSSHNSFLLTLVPKSYIIESNVVGIKVLLAYIAALEVSLSLISLRLYLNILSLGFSLFIDSNI